MGRAGGTAVSGLGDRAVPVDVWSVRASGAGRWLQGSGWPVSDLEARRLARGLEQSWLDAIGDAEPAARDAGIASYKAVNLCWQFIHTVWIQQRLRQRGQLPLVDDRTPYAAWFRGGVPPQTTRAPAQRPSRTARFRARVGALTYAARSGTRHVSVTAGSWPGLLSWGYPSSQHLQYAARLGARPAFIHPGLLPQRFPSAAASDGQAAFADAFFSRAAHTAAELGVELSPEAARELRRGIDHWAAVTFGWVEAFHRLIPRGGGTLLLAESLGATLLKCFSIAAERNGHAVVGFPHGHVFGQHDVSSIVYNELAVVDRYVAASQASMELNRRLLQKYPLPGKRHVEIDVLPSDYYLELWQRLSRDTRPGRVETVMFMEFPLTPHRYEGSGSYWVFQARLLARAALLARRLGFRTVLKRHPDRLAESAGFYDGVFDALITERFEESYRQADAFFFPYVGSTTFPFALLTNRIVIVPDRCLDETWPDVRRALADRCRVVRATPDEDGTLTLDSKAFHRALVEPIGELDYGFAHRYLFPTE